MKIYFYLGSAFYTIDLNPNSNRTFQFYLSYCVVIYPPGSSFMCKIPNSFTFLFLIFFLSFTFSTFCRQYLLHCSKGTFMWCSQTKLFVSKDSIENIIFYIINLFFLQSRVEISPQFQYKEEMGFSLATDLLCSHWSCESFRVVITRKPKCRFLSLSWLTYNFPFLYLLFSGLIFSFSFLFCLMLFYLTV